MANTRGSLRGSLWRLGSALSGACATVYRDVRWAMDSGRSLVGDGKVNTVEERIINRIMATLPDVLAQYEFVIVMRPKESKNVDR